MLTTKERIELAALRSGDVDRYAFNEADHPRGQPNNAGQFVKGQGVKVGKSVGSKIKGGDATVVSGPHKISGVTGHYLVEQNGVQEHHHESRLKATGSKPVAEVATAPSGEKDDRINRAAETSSQNGFDRGSAGTIKVPDAPLPAGKYPEGDPRNDPKYEAYTQKIDAKIDQYLKEGKDTESLHSVVKNGKRWYSPERRKQHRQLVKHVLESYAKVPNERKAWLIAGPSGAGKSTFLKQQGAEMGLQMGKDGPTNAAIVNPDDIKDHMIKLGLVPEYPGLQPSETAALTHEESSHLSKLIQRHLLRQGKNVAFDLTMASKPEKFMKSYVQPARAHGYGKINAAFVDGDIPTSLYRAGKRHQSPDAQGNATMSGRYVPYGIVAQQAAPPGSKYKSANRGTFEDVAQKGAFNSVIVFDNKTGHIERRR